MASARGRGNPRSSTAYRDGGDARYANRGGADVCGDALRAIKWRAARRGDRARCGHGDVPARGNEAERASREQRESAVPRDGGDGECARGGGECSRWICRPDAQAIGLGSSVCRENQAASGGAVSWPGQERGGRGRSGEETRGQGKRYKRTR